jgi:hypothetical protein
MRRKARALAPARRLRALAPARRLRAVAVIGFDYRDLV